MPPCSRIISLGAWVLAAGLAGCAPSHETAGLVLRIDRGASVITVSHEPIPGVMDAMVMPLAVADRDALAELRPGDRIRFRLRIGRQQTSIDRIRILSAAASGADVPAPSSAARALAIDAEVPPFQLTDQYGALRSSRDLLGRIVVVGFIYTRCPLPDYCPRVMTNFSVLRDRFASRLGKDVVLLTLTFDPRHDTSAELHAYGARYGANVPGWYLLTGEAGEIERVCTQFGVEFYPDEGMLSHTLQTAVIDRQGRLAARAEGREFGAKQLGDLVEELLR